MTPDEAIEILADVADYPGSAIRTDFPPAAKLGIEALELELERRHKELFRPYTLLPSETRD